MKLKEYFYKKTKSLEKCADLVIWREIDVHLPFVGD